MRIKNHLIEDSFDYRQNKTNCDLYDCIVSLGEINDYVTEINERLYFDDAILYEQEIITGVTLATWLWTEYRDGNNKEYKDLLEQILTKPTGKVYADFDTDIDVSLYPLEGYADTCTRYVEKRRGILAQISDRSEFYDFLQSCFIDSAFSLQTEAGLSTISGFERHVKEIVDSLAVLNDEAVDLYYNHKTNLSLAFKTLSAKLLDCAPDPANAHKLRFEFMKDNGESVTVECSPHAKLIRKDSDLRIYFYWCHDEFGEGRKVLIGRIGVHPY